MEDIDIIDGISTIKEEKWRGQKTQGLSLPFSVLVHI